MLAGLIVLLASNVSNTFSLNSPRTTESDPRAGSISDSLFATFDLSEKWSLNAGLMLTAEDATPAAKRGQFGTSGAVIMMFYAGADWDASDHWSLALDLDWSPKSTQQVGADIQIGTASGQALIQSASSQAEGQFSAAYETAGFSDLEWAFSAGIGYSHLSADQAITRAHIGTLTFAQIKAACATQPTRPVCQALDAHATIPLDSEKLSLSATAIVLEDTDVTLSGDFYHYEQDPNSLPFPSLTQLGMGLPIAPLEWLARGEVAHRFGDFQAKLYVQGGRYEPGTGDTTKAVGVKLQYKFSRAFKLWLTGIGQSDVGAPNRQTDAPGQEMRSTTVALGAQYRF